MDRTVALGRLGGMVASTARPVLSPADLDGLLDSHAIVDRAGRLVTDAGWEPTWDLDAAAADGWEWKAGRVAGDFTFSADDASYSKGDVMAKMLDMAATYRAKSLTVLGLADDRAHAPYDSPRLVL